VSAVLPLLAASLLASPSLSSAARASAPPVRSAACADGLDELIAASRSIKCFSAHYTLAFELNPGVDATPPPDGVIRIHQGVTGCVRVERSAGDETLLIWCNASTMAMQMRAPAGERFGRFDVGALDAQAARLRAQLEELFPQDARGEPARAWEGPVALMSWSFDDQARRANFEVTVATMGTVASPLGWLDTLRSKQVELARDGERLRFESDAGRFRGALRALDGVLETLVGESPNGRLTLSLHSFSLEPPDQELLEPPVAASPGARDFSNELRRSVLSSLHLRLRLHGYRAVARCPSLDQARAASASGWLTSFHEFAISSTLAPWFELLEKRRATLVERLKAYSASGRTKAQVEEQRQRELASLARGIDELAKTFDGLLQTPDARDAAQHAQEFHELEQRSFAAAFDRLVRRKVLAEFEVATKLE